MSAISLIALVFMGLLVLKTTSREASAGPAPDIESVSPPKSSAIPDDTLIAQQQQQAEIAPIVGKLQQAPALYTNEQAVKQLKTTQLDGEKLRRGLSNFLNNLNPAPYFVPAAPLTLQQQQPTLSGATKTQTAASGLQSEPATIINDSPTADALIKGPNRLYRARPLGGPLRWGRK